MKKMMSLFRILFNSTYGISHLKYKMSKNRAEIVKPAAIILVIIVSLLPLLAAYTAYMSAVYDVYLAYGQPGVIITMGAIAASTIVIFFGFFYVISTFYFTGDTEHLITLPLKPSQILGAKFGVVLAGEYITSLPLALPPIIVYGVKSGAGILYWVYSLLGALAIPIIPLCLTSIIAVVVMRVTNIGKKRDLLRIIGGVVGIFLMLGIQAYIQRVTISGDPEKLNNLLFSENGLVSIVSKTFPPAAWISISLIEYESIKGFLMLLLFIGVSALFLGGFHLLGEKLFLGGYVGSHEAGGSKKIDEGRLSREVSPRGRVMAVFWREFKILNRVPIFFLNCVLPVILVPAIFVMMLITGGNQMLSTLQPLVAAPGGIFVVTIIVVGIGAFTGAANMVAPTSISREGTEFFVSKYIPVSPRDQLLGKMLHAMALFVAGDILVLTTLGVILKLPAANLVISFVISSLIVIAFTEIGLMIDMFRPLLVWDNPQKAVKQNLNGVISMFGNAAWAAALLFAAARFISIPWAAYLLLTVILLILDIVLYRVLMAYGSRRYMEIEP